MDFNKAELEFAYKYPFSKEAKEIVYKQSNKIDVKYLELGDKNIENAINKTISYKQISIDSVKLDYVMSYLYSRMLLSALKRIELIKTYAMEEAKRSSEALENSENAELIKLAMQLGVRLNEVLNKQKVEDNNQELTISFTDYVSYAPKSERFELVNQKLSGGIVLLNKGKIVRLLEQAIIKEITKGLPIKSSELPKEVLEYSKNLKYRFATKTEERKGKTNDNWIERLLETPIADVRHRTVNLILSPYLVNTKGLSVEQATKTIIDYIERCKQIDPNTKINDRYIEYQCNYAKRRALKPLSINRARELLGDIVEEDKIKENKKV